MNRIARASFLVLVLSGLAWAPARGAFAGEGERVALSSVDKDRILRETVERWTPTALERGYPLASWREELQVHLRGASDEVLERASRAASYAEVIETLTGKDPDRIYAAPHALGAKGIDLLFFPITPCRVLDTRLGNGPYAGPLTAGSTTSIATNVTSSIQQQGGNPAGCPLPTSDAGAIAFNVTVTGFDGVGFATLFPATATRPNASTINWGPGEPPIANASAVQQCVSCGTGDVSIYLEGSSSHVIVDVVGYFDLAPTLTCSAGFTSNLTLTGPCLTATSCSITNPAAGSTRRVMCRGSAVAILDHFLGTDTRMSLLISTSGSVCDDAPYGQGTGVLEIPSQLPTLTDWRHSIDTEETLTIPAGQTRTLHLNALKESGLFPIVLDSGQIICSLQS